MNPEVTVPEDEVVIGQDLYADDPSSYDDGGSTSVPITDPVSDAVGSPGYMQHFILDGCIREFADGTWREPERFDRFYFVPQVPDYDGLAPLLIDVIVGDSPEQKRACVEQLHVDFKRQWIANNAPVDAWNRPLRYVTIDEADQWGSVADLHDKLASKALLPYGTETDGEDTAASADGGLVVTDNPTVAQDGADGDEPAPEPPDLPPAAQSPQTAPQAATSKVQRPRRQRARKAPAK